MPWQWGGDNAVANGAEYELVTVREDTDADSGGPEATGGTRRQECAMLQLGPLLLSALLCAAVRAAPTCPAYSHPPGKEITGILLVCVGLRSQSPNLMLPTLDQRAWGLVYYDFLQQQDGRKVGKLRAQCARPTRSLAMALPCWHTRACPACSASTRDDPYTRARHDPTRSGPSCARGSSSASCSPCG